MNTTTDHGCKSIEKGMSLGVDDVLIVAWLASGGDFAERA